MIVILVIAMITDVRTGRISNRLMLIGFLTGLITQIATHGVAGFGAWISSVSIPVILCSILFFMRALGAGDVKLLSIIGGLSNFETICYCMLFSFFAGAVLALVQMLRKGIFYSRMLYFFQYVQQVVNTGKLAPYEKEDVDVHADHIMHFSVAIGIGYGLCRGYLRWAKG